MATKYARKKLRARDLYGRTYPIQTDHGELKVTVNWSEDGQMFEVFGHLDRLGPCQKADMEAITRLCSTALRYGVPVKELIDQLGGIQCEPIWDNGMLVKSIADAISKVLRKARRDGPPFKRKSEGPAATQAPGPVPEPPKDAPEAKALEVVRT